MYFTVMDSNGLFSILVVFNSAFHCCESFLQHQDKKLYFLLFVNKKNLYFLYLLSMRFGFFPILNIK